MELASTDQNADFPTHVEPRVLKPTLITAHDGVCPTQEAPRISVKITITFRKLTWCRLWVIITIWQLLYVHDCLQRTEMKARRSLLGLKHRLETSGPDPQEKKATQTQIYFDPIESNALERNE